MRRIIEENIESLIPNMIARSRNNKDKYCLYCPYPIWRLGAKEGAKEDAKEKEEKPEIAYFPDFIEGLDGGASDIIWEFKEFAKKWKRVEGLVPFEFKYITPMEVV